MSKDLRKQKMLDWLSLDIQLKIDQCEPASEDASFRRYFRIVLQPGSTLPALGLPGLAPASQPSIAKQYIVMDAPPEKEPLNAFIHTTQLLLENGINAPQIYASNIADGFLLLEDFGSINYLDKLPTEAETLYPAAIESLINLQLACFADPKADLPTYSEKKLHDEMQLFEDWYLKEHLHHQMSEAQTQTWARLKAFLVEQCRQQPQVWVHRDYHSRNLMVLDENSPGVIDYQDMVIGPLTYDLASIFKDCYIEWPRTRQLEWLSDYHKAIEAKAAQTAQAHSLQNVSFEQLVRWYDLTGLQRHLKVLGIFCRLNYRDLKPHYMNDLPLVKRYVLEVLPRYAQCHDMLDEFSDLLS